MLGFSYGNFKQLWRHYPLEIGFVLLFTVVSFFIRLWDFELKSIAIFNPAFATIYFALIYLSNRTKFYWFSWLIPLLISLDIVFLQEEKDQELHFMAFNFIAFLLLMAHPFAKENKAFLQNILRNLSSFILAGALAGVLFLSFLILKHASKVLLDISLAYYLNERIMVAIWIISYPLLFIYFNHNKQNKPFKFFAIKELLYLLSLVLVIYTVIIYVYLAGILIELELPKSRVSNMMLPYLALVLISKALYLLTENAKLRRLYGILPWLTVLPLALLWWGIVHRVNQYGLTVERILLINIVFFFSLACLFSLIKKSLKYPLLTLTAVILTLFSCVILSPDKIEQASQYQRFVKLAKELNIINAENKINPEFLKKYDDIKISSLNENKMSKVYFLFNDYVEDNKLAIAQYGKEELTILSQNLEEYYFENNGTNKMASYLFIYLEDLHKAENKQPMGIDIQPYQRFYPVKSIDSFELDEKMEKLASMPEVIEITDQNHHVYQLNTAQFFQSFEQAGIDLSVLHTEAELKLGSPKSLTFKSQDGRLLLLKMLGFKWVKFKNGAHYVPVRIELFGYFE